MVGSDKTDFRSTFFEECDELLEMVQDGLDMMEDDAGDGEAVNSVFRAVHSVKGGAGAFGLQALVDFAHKFETSLDAIRSGQVTLSEDAIDLFRHCGDTLSDLVMHARNGDDSRVANAAQLEARLVDLIGDVSAPEEEPEFHPVAIDLGGASPDAKPRTYVLSFKAHPELFASGNEPAALFNALKTLGETVVSADLEDVPRLDDLDAKSCAVVWRITLLTDQDEAAIRDVFEFVEDCCELTVERDCDAADLPDLTALEGLQDFAELEEEPAPDLPTLSDLIADTGAHDAADLGDVPDAETINPGPAPVDGSNNSGNTPNGAVAPVQTAQAPPKARSATAKANNTIRVDLGRIDKLINLVGELVIKEAMLSQSVDELDMTRGSGVTAALDSLKQIASEIQEGVMAIRAQPVKPMFQRMARIVREAGSATGKRVRFVTMGENTEVDKTVIERLVDPLTHMIRNAVDHGLESGEAREAAGKPAEGTITLSAAHRSGRVLIEVSDDGGGINRDVVRNLAVERGVISPSDMLSPADIDNLLFMPGFSSKDEVSELSGRGVGLDVVRSAIQKLGGRVTIHSEPGDGATFSISLPLTLAVLEGMVVDVSGETMVVPISSVQETVRPTPADIDRLGAGSMVLRNRGELVPVVDLGAFFGFRASPERLDDHVLLLIASDQGPRYALIVDEIQDQRQVVIKSLETNYQQISGVAAATILGDGRIALIIDADTIMRDLATHNAGDKQAKMAV